MKVASGIALILFAILFVIFQQEDSGNDNVDLPKSQRDLGSIRRDIPDGGQDIQMVAPPKDGDESTSGRQWLRASMADSSQNSEDVFEHLLSLKDRQLQRTLLKEFFRTLGQNGDLVGFDLLAKLKPGEIRSYSCSEFIGQFAPKDSASLSAALNWSKEYALPNEAVLFGTPRVLRNLDLDETLTFLRTPTAKSHPYLIDISLYRVAGAFAQKNMSLAEISKEIGKKIPDVESDKFFHSYAVTLARGKIEPRQNLIKEEWVPDSAKIQIVFEHGEAMRNNGEDPIPWLESLPQEGWANAGVSNFLRSWVSRDSFAASDKIMELPEGSELRKEGFKMVREFLIDKGEIEAAKEWELE